MKIPDELMAEIEADVERYRQVRIKAALRRMEEAAAKQRARERRDGPFKTNRDRINDPAFLMELAQRVVTGERMSKIGTAEFGYHKQTLRQKLKTWSHHLFYEEDHSDLLDRYWKLPFKDRLKEAIKLQRAVLTNHGKSVHD